MKTTGLRMVCALAAAAIATGAAVQTTTYAQDGYAATVLADSLNVRKEPAQQADVVGSLKNGAQVQVTDEKYGWAEVHYGSKTGWVAGYYLQKGGAPQAPAQDKAKNGEPAAGTVRTAGTSPAKSKLGIVTADTLNLRAKPDAASEIVGILDGASELQVFGNSQGWLQVRTGEGKEGWVSERYVDIGTAKSDSPAKTASATAGLKGKRIVVDPGHGGIDSGTIGTKYDSYEKTLNLSTAQLVASALKAAGAKVTLTRDKDTEVELSDRVAVSGAQNADAFISIHFNSGLKSSTGVVTFYYAERDKPLANAVQKELARGTNMDDGGVRFGDFFVLRENARPSLLLELGYLSNPKEEAAVRSKKYQEQVSQAVVKGLQAYFN